MNNKIAMRRHAQAGVSLVELMIGLTIGLIITAGALSVLFSNQKLILDKEVMDRSQENFRFATTTITRLIRQANELGIPTNNNELIVTFDRAQRDCLGQVDHSWINTFKVNDQNELVCMLNNDATKTYVLAKGITAISFAYGIQNGASANSLVYQARFNNSGAEHASVVSAWNTITSVQTQMSVSEGSGKQPTIDFIATSHLLALTKLASSGGPSHVTPPNNNPPNDPPNEEDEEDATSDPIGGDGEEDGNDTPPNNSATCSNSMLANITLTVATDTYSWGSMPSSMFATKGLDIELQVNSSADRTGWEIQRDDGAFSALSNSIYSLPNGKNKEMSLTLKCGTHVNRSVKFITN